MVSGDLRRTRLRHWGLSAAAGITVVLLGALLVYRYDLVHLDAERLADRVRAS